MITKQEYRRFCEYTISALEKANIALTPAERESVEVADFGLGRIDEIGLQVITYVNTERCCAKELVLTPWQICPEHRHPPINGSPGKEETFRCRAGVAYLYVSGESDGSEAFYARIPDDIRRYFTVFKQIVLLPGEQYTLLENSLHWFCAGENGCVVSEFSTKSVDACDVFTDPSILRAPLVQR